jgi:hypothetical protein
MCVQYRKDFDFMMQQLKKMITKDTEYDTNKRTTTTSGI